MNRKTLIGGVGVAAGVAVAVGALVFFQFRNTTTPVDAESALSRFEDATVAADTTTPAQSAPVQPGSVEGGTAAPPAPAPATTAPTIADVETTDDTGADPMTESGAAEPVRLPLPEPGVYRLALQGSESTDLLTGARHEYPDEGFLTVTSVECGVELRFDFIVERWQSLTLCDGEDGLEIAGEQIFHSFFGQEDVVSVACTDSPLGPGATSWSCAGESSIAERSVMTSVESRELADGSVSAVLVVTADLDRGDHPDNVESIEQWWHIETGLPVFERRSYDFIVDTPLGAARYVEDYELALTSFDPIT